MKLTRRTFMSGITSAATLFLVGGRLRLNLPLLSRRGDRVWPNVIFILADDLGWGDLQLLRPA